MRRNSANTHNAAEQLEGKAAKIIIASLILCSMFCLTSFAQTKPDDPLDKDSANALIEELVEGLESAIEDEDSVNAILEKWISRDLVGKTRVQAIDILFEDVKSVVKDTGVLKRLRDRWNLDARGAKPVETPNPETPEPTPVPEPTPTPSGINPNVTPVERSATEGMIDLGAPPLTDGEMTQVMSWIATSVSALRLPYCWKNTYGRTAGVPMVCREGFNQDTAGLCYSTCGPNERGIATFCYANCPAGLPDNGLYCEKRGEYGRGAGYPIWDEGKCNKDNPQGCEKSGLIWYPKCKPGYAPFGCCLCKPACPPGWEDIGVSCKKPSRARVVEPLTTCAPGLEKNGALCYPQCKETHYGVGPVCWQKCPSQQSWDCGAGCATTQKECALAVINMVAAPIIAAVNIASIGSASAATSAAKAGASVATGGAAAASQATRLSRLTQIANGIKSAMTAAKGSVTTLVGGAQNLARLQNVVKIGGKIYVAQSAIGREIDLFSKEFADHFDVLTSPEIAREIDQRFGKEAAYQIKRQWGIRHLSLMLEADGFSTGKNVLSLASAVDPTGLLSVANAFMHPICKGDTPFPKVTPLYNH